MKFVYILLVSVLFISCASKNERGYIEGNSMSNLPYDKYINDVKVELDNETRSQIAEYDSHIIELFYNYNKSKEDIKYRQKNFR